MNPFGIDLSFLVEPLAFIIAGIGFMAFIKLLIGMNKKEKVDEFENFRFSKIDL